MSMRDFLRIQYVADTAARDADPAAKTGLAQVPVASF